MLRHVKNVLIIRFDSDENVHLRCISISESHSAWVQNF